MELKKRYSWGIRTELLFVTRKLLVEVKKIGMQLYIRLLIFLYSSTLSEEGVRGILHYYDVLFKGIIGTAFT